MKPFSIRLRLTLWYFAILAGGLLAFAVFTLAALHHAIYQTVDGQLAMHMAAVQQIIGEDENQKPQALTHDLDEDVELAPEITLLQIWDQDGRLIYRSAAMNRMGIPNDVPHSPERPVTSAYQAHRVRVLVERIATPRATNVVMVAIPIQDFFRAIHQVEGILWIAILLLLGLSAAGGYWIAGRALSPILTMIVAAEAIGPGDLSTRVQVPPANDELQRLASTLNDMLERLQAGFERITRFTADASHELRTPIALLRTRTEVLLRRPRSVDEYRTAHEANLITIENTSALLEKLMLLARADAGAETLHFVDVDLTEIVRGATAAMRPMADAKCIEWAVTLPSQPVFIAGDDAALSRLLLALLDNAVKHTPENGSIQIALEACGDWVIVKVSDTGIGMAEEVLPKIFERFYRADPSRTTDGAGLGLSIAEWIAIRHSGSIGVASTPGRGTVFSVKLPLKNGGSRAV